MPPLRKKLDSRIRTLVENGVKEHYRSLFVIVGDKGRDQVVNLHVLLSKAQVKARPSVLWCYKKELGFSSHRKKRMKKMRKEVLQGLREADQEDPFDMFVTATNIRYVYYKDTHKVLGSTYGMCVIQDFEAMTPNLLARTIESVEGGGIVVLLLRTMTSLRQLYSLSMDVHARFRTESHQRLVPRFNERFILSLSTCRYCLACDDELNVLPITAHIRDIKPVTTGRGSGEGEGDSDGDGSEVGVSPAILRERRELESLATSLADTQPAGSLVKLAKTLDQAKAVLTFVEAISEKTLRSTVSLTAARGRGKSAAMGLAVAGAVGVGYANIFVTSPSPENLTTYWVFVLKGLEALGYREHSDYEVVQSTNPDFQGAVVRLNVFREQHRQTIQYIMPHDAEKLAQAELVVVDECAAIPLPVVRRLLGPYLVFLSSTISGYEGTGRSLSLKLIKELRDRSVTTAGTSVGAGMGMGGGRVLREVTLETPIRYASGDAVEKWLYKLLCLDASIKTQALAAAPALAPLPVPVPAGAASTSAFTPHPSKCDLYHVSRDALFSFHNVAETFLQRIWSLYVSAHYKNSPNDLQLLSDAPAHSVFVLLGPVDPAARSLPEVLTVIQVAFEGAISAETARASQARAQRPTGDLIPWTLAQQYQDSGIAQLSGARVVRIATDPQYQGMGYGARALELLGRYFEGELYDADADAGEGDEVKERDDVDADADAGSIGMGEAEVTLLSESLEPRKRLPPLLQKISRRVPERLHYFGVSFGLTQQLFNFWNRVGCLPLYLRQSPNELTGEHTCIMVRPLRTAGMEIEAQAGWVRALNTDFRRRCMSLLSYQFRDLPTALALALVSPPSPLAAIEADASGGEGGGGEPEKAKEVSKEVLDVYFTPHDLERLASYANNLVDYHVVVDLLPRIAALYFAGHNHPHGGLPSLSLSRVQSALLVAMGLQCRDIDFCATSLDLPPQMVLALFNKACRKFSTAFRRIAEREHAMALPRAVLEGASAAVAQRLGGGGSGAGGTSRKVVETVDEDLADGARLEMQRQREQGMKTVREMDMSKFASAAALDIDEGIGGGGGVVGGLSAPRASKDKKDKKEKGDVDDVDGDGSKGDKRDRKGKGKRMSKGHGKSKRKSKGKEKD